jgi:Asp-tRNA(Asn)/Glu-tRNA(Gln) amidotransferase A subunit family amidase
VIVGKTVTTEFALFQAGPTTNPHDSSRTPGGSSSGSASAVGARTIPLTLGTQTAGSVVRPASFCGVVGVKPTFGAISTRGVKPCSPSLDTVGVFTGDVAGAAHVLPVLTGAPQREVADREPVRVGFARTPEWYRVPATTRTLLEQAVALVAAELEVVEVDVPFAGLAEAQTVLMQVESTQALAVERAHHAELLSTTLQIVLQAGDHMAWAYQAARGFVDRCRARLPDIFAGVDVLLTPSVLGEAPPLAEGTGDPLLCRAWTALGTPAVSVPGLTGPAGLPVGVQVVAPPGKDELALAGAHQIATILAPRAGE